MAKSRYHAGHTAAERLACRRVREEFRLRVLLAGLFMEHVDRQVLAAGELGQLLDSIATSDLDPHTAAGGILARALERGDTP